MARESARRPRAASGAAGKRTSRQQAGIGDKLGVLTEVVPVCANALTEALERIAALRLARLEAPGEVLAGRYQIENVLAEGGMGYIYQATQPQLQRRVAIKVVRPELLGSEEAINRFVVEARAMANLVSEHVV